MSIRSWVQSHPVGKRSRAIAVLADGCDVTPAAVRHWVSGIRRVPPSKCPVVERITGIKRAELRPDVYGKAGAPK